MYVERVLCFAVLCLAKHSCAALAMCVVYVYYSTTHLDFAMSSLPVGYVWVGKWAISPVEKEREVGEGEGMRLL